MKREWKKIKDYKEILFDFYEGIARITINRERYRNAFTPTTTAEMSDALYYCRECPDINVVVLTGAGDIAFCAGGDMHVKGRGGYIDEKGVPRLSVLDVQKQIRSLPKPVIAMVNGYAIGGEQSGHIILLDYATTGDGQLSGAMILSIMKRTGEKLSQLAKIMERLPQVLINVKVSREGKLSFYTDREIKAEIERVSEILGDRGRILVRVSGTEPLVRVMLEGENLEEIQNLAEEAAQVVRERLA